MCVCVCLCVCVCVCVCVYVCVQEREREREIEREIASNKTDYSAGGMILRKATPPEVSTFE